MSQVNRPYRLLFVCTGNICRSPMAFGLAEAYRIAHGLAIEVDSASTLGLQDFPADPNAIAVCAEIGVDIAKHKSKPLTDALCDWADYVLVMEFHHAAHIRDQHPQVSERLLMLGSFGDSDEIGDPIGGWRFRFRRCRDEIKVCIDGFLGKLPARSI